MIPKKGDGLRSLRRRRGIVGIDLHVCIEKRKLAHLRSCSCSRLNFHPRELPLAARESRSNSAASASGNELIRARAHRLGPASCLFHNLMVDGERNVHFSEH